MNQWTSGLEGSRKHLKVRKCLYPDINDNVYEWFVVARSKNICVSGPLIKEKALILSLELGYDNFSASNGWLDRFRQRHNIKYSVLSGESAAVSEGDVDDWKLRLKDICQGYELKDI